MEDYKLRGSDIEDLKLLDSFLRKLPLVIPIGIEAECYTREKPVEEKPVKKKADEKQVEKKIKEVSYVSFYPPESVGSIDEVRTYGSKPFTFKSIKNSEIQLEYENVTIGVSLKTDKQKIEEKAKKLEEKLKYLKFKCEIDDEDLNLEELGIK